MSVRAKPAIDRESGLAIALADELDALAAATSALGTELMGDIATMQRHMTSLQAIDRVTQMQCAIAALLRSGEPIEARLAAIPLEDLADRLHARCGISAAVDEG